MTLKTASSLITGARSSGMGPTPGKKQTGLGMRVFRVFFTLVNFVRLACVLTRLQWSN